MKSLKLQPRTPSIQKYGIIARISALLLVIGIANLAACSDSDKQTVRMPQQFSIVYSGNMDGELEPCGCTEAGDFGGIRRRATKIQQLRKQHKDLFVLSTGGLINRESPQDALVAEYIFQGLSLLNYDAIGLQWKDLSFGLDASLAAPLPWVATNAADPAPASKILREIQAVTPQGKLAVFNWLDPNQAPQSRMQTQHAMFTVKDDINGLSERLQQAQTQGYITVLFTTLPLTQAAKTLPLQRVNILFLRSAYEIYGEPQVIRHNDDATTLALEPGSRGMRLGLLQMRFDARGKLEHFDHEVIPLGSDVADADSHTKWYQAYNQAVKADYEKRVAIEAAQQAGDSPYVGAQACQSCHSAIFQTWEKTRHAHAFDTLSRVQKSFDPKCIACHVVGFNAPGGFLDNLLTPDLAHVQCESCHGAARAHSKNPRVKPAQTKAPTEICSQCHNHEHSPLFSFKQYWPKIKH